MATSNTILVALVDALDCVDIYRLFDDELSDYVRMADSVWDAATRQLFGEPVDPAYAMDDPDDVLSVPDYVLLTRLSYVMQDAWIESEMREYRYGDSDWNPYSRMSVASYTDRYPHRAGSMPRKRVTHAQRKLAQRQRRDLPRYDTMAVSCYVDDEIPF